ncbi:MAG TPA: glycoside hydrolase family 2 TIM barrel-domain containing protein, partial [Roseiflexaceae bacterium]|nr:glycoside hydrolase family 2 TIM barrel-domain containing protein [Roseiflexaceae bacterium]
HLPHCLCVVELFGLVGRLCREDLKTACQAFIVGRLRGSHQEAGSCLGIFQPIAITGQAIFRDRTFEVRDGDGLYLNGQKIILKGVNRHSFWPDSGQCLSETV